MPLVQGYLEAEEAYTLSLVCPESGPLVPFTQKLSRRACLKAAARGDWRPAFAALDKVFSLTGQSVEDHHELETVLGAALEHGHPEAAQMVHTMFRHWNWEQHEVALESAVRGGNVDAVAQCFRWEMGADRMDRVLVLAAELGHTDLVVFALNRGARLFDSAYVHAAAAGHLNVVKLVAAREMAFVTGRVMALEAAPRVAAARVLEKKFQAQSRYGADMCFPGSRLPHRSEVKTPAKPEPEQELRLLTRDVKRRAVWDAVAAGHYVVAAWAGVGCRAPLSRADYVAAYRAGAQDRLAAQTKELEAKVAVWRAAVVARTVEPAQFADDGGLADFGRAAMAEYAEAMRVTAL